MKNRPKWKPDFTMEVDRVIEFVDHGTHIAHDKRKTRQKRNKARPTSKAAKR